MSYSELVDYKIVVNTIHHWSAATRLALAQYILKILAFDLEANPPLQDTFSQTLGLLTTDQPPPSDADVKD